MVLIDDLYDAGLKLELSDEAVNFVMFLLRSYGREEFQIYALDILCKISFNFPHLLHRVSHCLLQTRSNFPNSSLAQFIDWNLIPIFLTVAKNHFETDALSFSCFGILQLAQALIAADPIVRDKIIGSGIFEIIKPCISTRVWTASWFVVYCMPPSSPAHLQNIAPVVAEVLRTGFPTTLSLTLDSLNQLPLWDENYAQVLTSSGIVSILETLLKYPNRCISRLALKILNTVNSTLVFDGSNVVFDS
jgi:hypothetical protein